MTEVQLKEFPIVYWVKHGRVPVRRKIDIVRRSWMRFNSKKKIYKVQSYFPPYPYDIVDKFLEKDGPCEPLESWGLYTAKIVGQSGRSFERYVNKKISFIPRTKKKKNYYFLSFASKIN